MAEGRDWFEVVEAARCPDCGYDATALHHHDLGPRLIAVAESWEALLSNTPPQALRRRPAPATWSALEYAAHVRDTLAVFDERIGRALLEHEPELGWWDHEAAVLADAYNDQPPAAVAGALVAHASALATRLAAIDDDDSWSRVATRRGRERFRVDGLARFVLHEAQHHRHDAEVGLR